MIFRNKELRVIAKNYHPSNDSMHLVLEDPEDSSPESKDLVLWFWEGHPFYREADALRVRGHIKVDIEVKELLSTKCCGLHKIGQLPYGMVSRRLTMGGENDIPEQSPESSQHQGE